MRLARKRSLLGGGELKIEKTFDLTPLSEGQTGPGTGQFCSG